MAWRVAKTSMLLSTIEALRNWAWTAHGTTLSPKAESCSKRPFEDAPTQVVCISIGRGKTYNFGL